MKEYREPRSNNTEDLLAFAEARGYAQLAHQSDNAVAMLVLAERQQMKPMWLNAFSHCIGMNDVIEGAPDYEVCCSRAIVLNLVSND